eukprot:2042692-Alexandrium_andersonii.AAC.1
MPDSSAWGSFSVHPPYASGSQLGRGRLESSRLLAVESVKETRKQSRLIFAETGPAKRPCREAAVEGLWTGSLLGPSASRFGLLVNRER